MSRWLTELTCNNRYVIHSNDILPKSDKNSNQRIHENSQYAIEGRLDDTNIGNIQLL